MRTIRLITDSYGPGPALNTAVSRVILKDVSSGRREETLRLFKPQPIVAFGRIDLACKGYKNAVKAARAMGFEAVNRLAGGRAAVFHQGTIAFSWTIPDQNSRANVKKNFKDTSDLMVHSFRRLGVDARVGETPGEYCPGEYSVNAGGRKKLAGVGQMLTSGASHVGGVVVVGGSRRIQDVLIPVYAALEIKWDPRSVGSIEEEVEGVGYEDVKEVIIREFSYRYDLVQGSLNPDILARAMGMEHEYIPD